MTPPKETNRGITDPREMEIYEFADKIQNKLLKEAQ